MHARTAAQRGNGTDNRMNVTSIRSSGITPDVNNPTTVGFGDLSSEDFFALMIAELQQQDPLKPQDNQQLLSQMSNIRQIEQSTRMADTLEAQMSALEQQTRVLENLTSQKFGDPASLIGLYVLGPGVDDSGAPVIGSDGKQAKVEGIVIGVDYSQDGDAILKLHTGQSITADTVEKVKIVVPEEEPEGPVGQNPPPSETSARFKSLGEITLKQDPTPKWLRNDSVAALLDSLFSPGAGLQLGA